MLPDFIANKSILTPLLLIITSLSKFAFMLILVSGVIFAFYRTNLHDWLMKITPYGKMSLTNYITQSIIGSLLFYNWGLALHSQLGITASFLVGVVLFIVQLAFCRWWMSRHAHGPLEYHFTPAIFEKMFFPFFQISLNSLFIGITAETSNLIVASGIFQLKHR